MDLQQAREILEQYGYQVQNLWRIEDVKANYNCTDAEAMIILHKALTNETTMEQVFLAIDMEAEEMGFEKIETDLQEEKEELIPITYGFIKNTFGWRRFCDVTNHNHYAINERGEPDLNDTFNVTKEQLDKLI
jgi:hypothetical protein